MFVSSADETNRATRALSIDRKSGKVVWDEQVSTGYGYGDSSNFASPSPVTDGKVAVFLYGNGDLAAFDLSVAAGWPPQPAVKNAAASNNETDDGLKGKCCMRQLPLGFDSPPIIVRDDSGHSASNGY